MNRKGLLRTLMMHFFICYTCTMMATILFCGLNMPRVTELPGQLSMEGGVVFHMRGSSCDGVLFQGRTEPETMVDSNSNSYCVG